VEKVDEQETGGSKVRIRVGRQETVCEEDRIEEAESRR
jgi:hypothetical protein